MDPTRLFSVFAFAIVAAMVPKAAAIAEADPNPVAMASSANITILSTNLANGNTVGEWGLSALVEADGQCILFDAGRFAETVVHNANELGVDLTCVDTIVLSHFHFDHTGGLFTVLEAIRKKDPNKRVRTIVARGFFEPRSFDTSQPMGAGMQKAFGAQWNKMVDQRAALESAGLDFVIVDEATEIANGVWVTGPVERLFDEKNYPVVSLLTDEHGAHSVDIVPDSQGLVVRTAEGPIVISGCGHAGAVNLVSHVQAQIQDQPVLALMGGLHLFNASDETLAWTGEKLNKLGVLHLMAGHCTGVHPMYALRDSLGLTRQTAVIGAVGARFELGHGIHPTPIAQ